MKKIILLMAISLLSLGMSAQTLKASKFTDNTYVGLSIGANSHPANWFDNDPVLGTMNSVRVGKWLTPISGLEVDGSVTFYDFYRHINYTTVGMNYLFNLNNAIHGWKGQVDFCEVVPFVGMAWMRNYDAVTNDLASKMGAQVNFNLGAAKAWQVNIIPAVTWRMTNCKGVENHQPYFNSHRADLSLQVGVTYKFKNQYGTHGFVICDKLYTQAEMDAINAEVNNLREANARLNAELDACNARKSQVLYKEIPTMPSAWLFPVITFNKNSDYISNSNIENVKVIAKTMLNVGGKYTLTGYASEEGTEDYNLNLSTRRAAALRDLLIKEGVNPAQLQVVGAGETTQFGNELDLNRVVVTSNAE